jgi:antitoxin VapB
MENRPKLPKQKEAPMIRSMVFNVDHSQAVRLPKDVAFPEDVHEVEIIKIGESRLVCPVGKRWDDLFENGPRASEDFMNDRNQPGYQDREPF